jgi:hypothetical protein
MIGDPIHGRHAGWAVPFPGSDVSLYRFLGVRLAGPPPLRHTYLPLSAGVHALYGPNGVGKTKVLEGVHAALTGKNILGDPAEDFFPAGQFLFAQLGSGEEADALIFGGELMSSDLFEELRKLIRQHTTWVRSDDVEGFLEDLKSQPAEIGEVADLREAIEIWLRIDDEESGYDLNMGLEESLAKEVAHSGHIAISTNGQAVLCIDEQSASPKLREAIVDTFRAAREEQETGEELEPPFRWTLSGHYDAWIDQEFRPGWSPIVLGALEAKAPIFRPAVIWVGSEIELFQHSKRTGIADALTEMVRRDGLLGESGVLTEKLPERVVRILEAANRYYEIILGKPIGLGIEIGDLISIHNRTHPRIVALDSATSRVVPLGRLSATESRWAKVAFLLAWNQFRYDPIFGDQEFQLGVEYALVVGDNPPEVGQSGLVLLIDEPELGLPWGIQRQLSAGLVKLSELFHMPVIAATHSAALLDDLAVKTFRCSRNDKGQVLVDEVLTTDRDALAKLGVPVSEELHLYKLVLIVEGRHEEILLKEMFGEEIAANRIKLLPIRGTRQLRLLAAGSEVLFRYFNAPFVLLTDRTRTQAATKALAAAATSGGPEEARTAIEKVFNPSSDEEQVLRSLLISAVESERIDRIRAILGFEKDDILHYLPCEHFVPGSNWDELLELHGARTDGPNDFKRWLELTRDVDLSDEHLRSAIREMDQIPIEWTNLINRCMEIVKDQESS